jgi:hypothetical protein
MKINEIQPDEFITALYRQLLNREPDESGFKTHSVSYQY